MLGRTGRRWREKAEPIGCGESEDAGKWDQAAGVRMLGFTAALNRVLTA